MKLWEAVVAFLRFMLIERGLSEKTIDSYRYSLRDFTNAVGGDRDAGGLTASEVSAWARSLAVRLAPSSQKLKITAARMLCRWLVSEGIAPDDAARDTDTPKIGSRLPVTITVAEARALLAAAVVPQERALIWLLYGCGLRISEAVELNLDDLQLSARLVRVFGKGSKERLVPMGSRVVSVIEAYLAGPRYALLRRSHVPRATALFPGRVGALTRQAAYAQLQRLCAQVGIRDCSPHVLRRAFATHLLQGGANLMAISNMLGHASVVTTEHYVAVDDDHLERMQGLLGR